MKVVFILCILVAFARGLPFDAVNSELESQDIERNEDADLKEDGPVAKDSFSGDDSIKPQDVEKADITQDQPVASEIDDSAPVEKADSDIKQDQPAAEDPISEVDDSVNPQPDDDERGDTVMPPDNPTKIPDPTDKPTEPPTEKPTEPPTDKPTEPPTDKPTEPPTEKPTTQPPTEKPTTEPPTEKPTTQAPTEKPTTENPTTIPVTTVVPTTTLPPITPGNYSVSDVNQTCIYAIMILEFDIPYKVDNNSLTAHVAVPSKVEVNGSCPVDNQTMSLAFGSNNIVTFTFSKTGTGSKNFVISSVELEIDRQSYFPNATDTDTNPTYKFKAINTKLFITQVQKSYKCDSKISVPLTDHLDHKNITMVMSNAQIQAFRSTKDFTFGFALPCSADEYTSDIVPIAVGCALAALVVIVIVAYLIGRRRARARGYQSM